MPVNFRELLKRNSKEINEFRPKSCPTCWLLGTISQISQEATAGGTEYLSLDMIDLEGHPGNEENLLDRVNLKSLRSPFRKNLSAIYWGTEAAIYHLTDMLDRVIGDPERASEERIPELKGLRVMFKVNPARDREGKEIEGQNDIDSRTVSLAEAKEPVAQAAE